MRIHRPGTGPEYSPLELMALLAAKERRGNTPEYEAHLERQRQLDQERKEAKLQTVKNRAARKALRKKRDR